LEWFLKIMEHLGWPLSFEDISMGEIDNNIANFYDGYFTVTRNWKFVVNGLKVSPKEWANAIAFASLFKEKYWRALFSILDPRRVRKPMVADVYSDGIYFMGFEPFEIGINLVDYDYRRKRLIKRIGGPIYIVREPESNVPTISKLNKLGRGSYAIIGEAIFGFEYVYYVGTLFSPWEKVGPIPLDEVEFDAAGKYKIIYFGDSYRYLLTGPNVEALLHDTTPPEDVIEKAHIGWVYDGTLYWKRNKNYIVVDNGKEYLIYNRWGARITSLDYDQYEPVKSIGLWKYFMFKEIF